MKHLPALAAVAGLSLAFTGVLASPAYAADPVTIDLLSVNDFHGRIEADPAANIAGAAVLAGTVKQYEAANPNTLFVGAGDFIGASTFTSFIAKDQPTIDAFNAMGLDASSFGNHEFDQGRDDVDNRILDEADWPYLAANLYDRATNKPAYQEYEVREIDGVSIGFVGAVTEDLSSLVSPAGIASLEVKPIVPEINRVADALSDGDAANGEADVVVLLVHEGAATTSIASATDPASPFGKIVNGADANIDMIISGHTHLAYDHEIPIPGTDKVRPVISSGQYGEKYAHTVLKIDPDSGDLLSAQADILPLVGAAPPDPTVAQIVATAKANADVLGAVELGSVTRDIKRGTQPSGENRGSESTIGNLIADAQLEAAGDLGAQLALMNPGGIRADLAFAPDGVVTYKEAATVQPFANTLVTIKLTGAQLKAVLEQQWQPTGAARPFLKLGVSTGFEYTYDPTAAAGSRITKMTLNGDAVAADQVITVVTNSFLAAGGDNFTAFTSGTGKADSGRIDLDAFVAYIKAHSPVTPDLAQRAVGIVATPPGNGVAYVQGESITLTLSSMLFSNGETSGDAIVSLGDQVLGSAPLDPTVVPTTDEQGRAAITFTVPAGVSGAQTLTIAGPGGTSIPYAISVAKPVKTTTKAWADHLLYVTGGNVGYNIRVTTKDGSDPVGTVTITDRGRTLTTVTLAAADHGRVHVNLPKLSRGVHLLRSAFTGNGYVASHSGVSVVAILR
jgi:5'-nucleotidase